jgi:hypothetical protein
MNGRGVPRGALSHGPQPRVGHAVPLVAQPVHGLCASVHVLLCPGVRAGRIAPDNRYGQSIGSRSTSTCSARAGSGAGLARRSSSGPRPIRTSPPGPLSPPRGCIEALSAVRSAQSSRDAHRARHRVGQGGSPASGVTFSIPTLVRRRRSTEPATRRCASASGRCVAWWTRASAQVSAAPILPGPRTGRTLADVIAHPRRRRDLDLDERRLPATGTREHLKEPRAGLAGCSAVQRLYASRASPGNPRSGVRREVAEAASSVSASASAPRSPLPMSEPPPARAARARRPRVRARAGDVDPAIPRVPDRLTAPTASAMLRAWLASSPARSRWASCIVTSVAP